MKTKSHISKIVLITAALAPQIVLAEINLVTFSVSSIQLSKDCTTAENQAADYAQRLAQAAKRSGPTICQSAIAQRKTAEIGILLNKQCPSGPDFDQQMRIMISQADKTIHESCHD